MFTYETELISKIIATFGKDSKSILTLKLAIIVKKQNFVTIYKGVKINNNVFIYPHVCFTKDIYLRTLIWNEGKITKIIIKDNGSIGAIATIISGITIGKSAMLGAGSVVTKDIPEYSLVFVIPTLLKGQDIYSNVAIN